MCLLNISVAAWAGVSFAWLSTVFDHLFCVAQPLACTYVHSSSVPCVSLRLRPLFFVFPPAVFTVQSIRTVLFIIPFNQCAHVGIHVCLQIHAYIPCTYIWCHVQVQLTYYTLFYCKVPVWSTQYKTGTVPAQDQVRKKHACFQHSASPTPGYRSAPWSQPESIPPGPVPSKPYHQGFSFNNGLLFCQCCKLMYWKNQDGNSTNNCRSYPAIPCSYEKNEISRSWRLFVYFLWWYCSSGAYLRRPCAKTFWPPYVEWSHMLVRPLPPYWGVEIPWIRRVPPYSGNATF